MTERENNDGVYDNDERGLAYEIRRQLKATPWYLTSTMAHMIVLLLLMLIPTTTLKRPPTPPVVIKTKIDKPIPDPVKDLFEPETQQNNIDEVIQELSRPLTSADTIIDPATNTNVPVDIDMTVNALDDLEDIPTQEDIAETKDDYTPNVLGVQGATLSSRNGNSSGFRGNFANIGRGIKGIVGGGKIGGMGKGLCLIWLLDQSGSMKDDQQKVSQQARDIQALLTDGGRMDMISGVVTYGKNWQLTQTLTRNANHITDAIMNVEVDTTGVENTCQAITWICQNIMSKKAGWTKVIVLLSDESASDQQQRYITPTAEDPVNMHLSNISSADRRLPMLEIALKYLVKEQTRLFVIGKESPFQRNYVMEPYTDQNGKVWSLSANRGPETPAIEVPISNATVPAGAGGNFKGAAMAGFGVYDLAYLAKGSKGAYFILDENTDAKRRMTPYERAQKPFAIDWVTMDMYAPQIISRAHYHDTLLQSGKQGRKVAQLNQYMTENQNTIRRVHSCSPSQHQHYVNTMRTRRELLVKLLGIIGDVKATDEELLATQERRQMANIDLWYATLIADQIITDSWLDAFESYRGSISNDAPEGYHAALVLTPKTGASLSEEEQLIFDDRMRQLTLACNEVIRRHSNTPYAVCARWLVEGPRQWGKPFELVRVIRKNGERRSPGPDQ